MNKKSQKPTEAQVLGALRHCSKADASRVLGVSQRTMQNWKQDLKAIGAVNDDGTVDCMKIIRWRAYQCDPSIAEELYIKGELQ